MHNLLVVMEAALCADASKLPEECDGVARLHNRGQGMRGLAFAHDTWDMHGPVLLAAWHRCMPWLCTYLDGLANTITCNLRDCGLALLYPNHRRVVDEGNSTVLCRSTHILTVGISLHNWRLSSQVHQVWELTDQSDLGCKRACAPTSDRQQ